MQKYTGLLFPRVVVSGTRNNTNDARILRANVHNNRLKMKVLNEVHLHSLFTISVDRFPGVNARYDAVVDISRST